MAWFSSNFQLNLSEALYGLYNAKKEVNYTQTRDMVAKFQALKALSNAVVAFTLYAKNESLRSQAHKRPPRDAPGKGIKSQVAFRSYTSVSIRKY